jgi:CheY-like chemotaxis protein
VKNTKQGEVTLSASPWQDSVAFEVRDTGTGVPAHLIAAAFEPFRQIRTGTGEAPRGTGLGLSITKQLVELMGGDLLFDSRVGTGTRVSFTLPQLPEDRDAEPEPALERRQSGPGRRGISPSGRARRVLIVEDDDSSRYGLKSLLHSEGYDVSEAADLREAGEMLGSRNPEAIVLDITLPDGDGAVWLSSLREKGPSPPPVIALTGVTADEDRRRIERAGVRTVLHKPVNIGLLFDALRDALAVGARF